MASSRIWARAFLPAIGLATLVAAAEPALAAVWVPGHYGPNGYWHPGHWAPGPGVVVGPGPARVWVPGHYGPNGYWHPGHWAWR